MPEIDLETSHGRTRATLRLDQGATPPSPADTAPTNDAKTGRFVKGNRAYRRRQLVQRAKGIATLNPSKVPTWLRPYVEQGAAYVTALLGMLGDRPALHALAGDCADAHAVYRATLAMAVDAEDPKVRASLMSEARGWLREHRTALATLSALAGGMRLPEPDPHEALARALREGAR
jgi:hypothetical protein